MTTDDRYRAVGQTLLADNWGHLTRYEYDFRRSDGSWQRQVREVYDRGNGVAALLHNPETDTVLLIRQFRLPAMVNDHPHDLIEVPAGLLEGDDPAGHMRTELQEETGYSVSELTAVFDTFTSPGSVSERLILFVGTYSAADRVADGGGKHDEGEDIEVLEVPVDEALAMIEGGEIIDAKTIMLLQHLALKRLRDT